jgi:hypothetical protein
MGNKLQSPLMRRAVFLVGNALIGLVLVVGLAFPVRDLLAERDSEVARKRAALARMLAIAAREGQIATVGPSAGDGEFLVGKTEGALGAEQQARLKGIAEAAGTTVRSIRNLPAKADGQLRYVGSHIHLLGPIAAVQRAIHTIETARPYLFVTAGTLRLAPTTGQTGAPHAPLLEAQLEVVGVLRSEAPAP